MLNRFMYIWIVKSIFKLLIITHVLMVVIVALGSALIDIPSLIMGMSTFYIISSWKEIPK